MSFIDRAKVEGMIREMEEQRRTAEMNFHRFDAALMALRALVEDADGAMIDNEPDIAPAEESIPDNG